MAFSRIIIILARGQILFKIFSYSYISLGQKMKMVFKRNEVSQLLDY